MSTVVMLADGRINYLNKALELFNTSMVVPVYFCYFTSATMVTSFILYRGLKAPATDLITMVLAFLVTCFGITLLQMSKVDPKALTGLDRRSTMLLQASKRPTEADEKGDVSAMEEPGMDALRGGFGAVGSIIRARSVSRRMSMGRMNEGGFGSAQHNTDGLAHFPRYTLRDNPMPDDHQENIAMSPQTPQTPGRQSTLKFDTSDMVHQYAYTEGGARGTGHSDAFHSMRKASTMCPLTGSFSGPPLAAVHEGVATPTREKSSPYADPYLSPLSPDHKHHQAERKTSFSQLFKGIATGHSEDDEERRPSAPRDYPRRADSMTERDERTALVTEQTALVSEPEELRSDPGSEVDLSSMPRRIGTVPSPAPSPTPQGPRRPMGPRASNAGSLSVDTTMGARPTGPTGQ